MTSNLQNQLETSKVQTLNYKLYTNIQILESWCCSISMNQIKTLLIAGCSYKTLIFQFCDNPKLLVSLIEETYIVSSISQKVQSNQVLIGNSNGTIKIFQKNGINNCRYLIKSKEHKGFITQLIINKDEQLLISSSIDGKIKFWNSTQLINCIQTIDCNLDGVLGISLNQSENQLISCGKQHKIVVMQKSNINQLWFISQEIQVQSYGYRLSFIQDNAFTYQPFFIEKLEIYQSNQENLLYNKINEVNVKKCYMDCLFPQIFIKNKSLLINKMGNLIYIFQIKDLTDIVQVQIIDFNTYNIYGAVSDDGDFLFTWDDNTDLITIRKLEEV
ncbi:unnamed protein product [Paramecium pentaurelia]|uniref:WD domain, G-beta repeat protein n=1 Tax=Paramecium pentaurelia TaxID=43138 RepID=A0A8S1XVQ2_9CILI|nr:unnamed protein product [Paramecium pentaurelia]